MGQCLPTIHKTNLLVVFVVRPNNKYVCGNYLSKEKMEKLKKPINIYGSHNLARFRVASYVHSLCLSFVVHFSPLTFCFCILSILLFPYGIFPTYFFSSRSFTSITIPPLRGPISKDLGFLLYVYRCYYFDVKNKRDTLKIFEA